jgi:hypothetical protein
MTQKFTANEARKLAGKTVEEKVDDLLVAIKERARKKLRELRTGYDYQGDEDLWIQSRYNPTKEWNEAKTILEDLGYVVGFYFDAGQFVDMYTIIKW